MADRPIRVLLVITRLKAGGPSRHVVWLAEGLSARGYETQLAAPLRCAAASPSSRLLE
jgi:hypothetical protein